MYVHRTMIVPSAQQALAQSIAASLGGDPGQGMWTTGLSPTGSAPATHYVSTGMIDEQFAPLLTDAVLMFGACSQAGLTITSDQCQQLVAAADVSDEPPFAAFERMGLQMVQSEA